MTRGWLQRLLAISSKFGVAMAYNLAYIYTEEMFPTTVRNTALVSLAAGSCSLSEFFTLCLQQA